MKFLELYIGAIILWSFIYKVGKILFEKNSNNSKFVCISSIVIFSAVLGYLNLINSEILQGVLKILIVYFMYYLFYKINFKSLYSKTIVVSLILYLSFVVAEVIVAIPLSVISHILCFKVSNLKNSIILNTIIPFFTYLIVYIFRKRLIKLSNSSKISKNSQLFIIIIILITIAMLEFNLPVSSWKLSSEFIITMIILLLFSAVGIFLLKQNSTIEETKLKYKQEVKYSKVVSKVTAEYRKANHEHKNELSVIRGMTNKNNKKLLDYLDVLIEKKNNIKYRWATELSYISLDGLKSLINYKLLEMEELNINITLTISKDISKMGFKNIDIKKEDNLYNIIGIYLDNAMQASAESKEKLVNIDIHKENKSMVIIIGNTYKGNINLNKLGEYGYTTKGKNHGVGLNIVRTILEEENVFKANRKLIDNYYVQELIVDLSKMKKKKTTKW